MSGDYSRFTFKPRKRFSGVLMQQGRVQLDADWNEEVGILKRRWEIQATDTFGPAAVPKKTTPDGFKILAVNPFKVGAGRLYVDGLLAERFADDPWYSNLALWPEPPPLTPNDEATIYLDVWEREVTYIEDAELLETALGGPDTATRTQVVWQIKVRKREKNDPPPACDSPLPPPSAGRLSTRAVAPPPSADPCVLPPTGNYRGLENRFYRVEIHDGGPLGTATFKWSQENASIVSRVTRFDGKKIGVTRIGRDKVLRFEANDWVEVTDDVLELAGLPGKMAKVVKPDEANLALELDRDVSAGFDPSKPERHTRVRRWDQKKDVDANGLLKTDTTGAWIKLGDDGVEVQITADPAKGDLRTGDAWSFAARAIDGSVEILTQEPPQVILHHYAHLATWDGSVIHDCRRLWPDECCCCTVEVGDGLRSHGDFDDILEAYEAAAAAFPNEDVTIRICLLPGVHRPRRTVRLARNRVIVSGCSRETRVEAPPKGNSIFEITGQFVRLEHLHLVSRQDDGDPLVTAFPAFETEIEGNIFECAARPLLLCGQSLNLRIRDNLFLGSAGIYVQGAIIRIEDNDFRGLGAGGKEEIGLINLLPWMVQVRVAGNRIGYAGRHGIVLFSYTTAANLQTVGKKNDLSFVSFSSDLLIEGNLITNLAGSGITVTGFTDGGALRPSGDQTEPVPIVPIFHFGLRIEHNTITSCAGYASWQRQDGAPQGAIVVGGIEHLEITDNHVEDIGISPSTEDPSVAGIYVGHARGLVMRDNVISNVGRRTAPVQRFDGGVLALDLEAGLDGWPAAMVHGNLIVSLRRSLTLLGLGPMQVTDNRFVSQEFTPVDQNNLGFCGAVLIYSHPFLNSYAARGEAAWTSPDAVLTDGSVLCSDNQVVLEQVLPFETDRAPAVALVVSILAFDDLAFQDNAVRCLAGTDLLSANTYLYGWTTRATGNGVFEPDGPQEQPFYSLVLPFARPNASRLPRLTTVTDNQTSHCIYPAQSSAAVVSEHNLMINCKPFLTFNLDEMSSLLIEASDRTRREMIDRITATARIEAAALRTSPPKEVLEHIRQVTPFWEPEIRARAAEKLADYLEGVKTRSTEPAAAPAQAPEAVEPPKPAGRKPRKPAKPRPRGKKGT